MCTTGLWEHAIFHSTVYKRYAAAVLRHVDRVAADAEAARQADPRTRVELLEARIAELQQELASKDTQPPVLEVCLCGPLLLYLEFDFIVGTNTRFNRLDWQEPLDAVDEPKSGPCSPVLPRRPSQAVEHTPVGAHQAAAPALHHGFVLQQVIPEPARFAADGVRTVAGCGLTHTRTKQATAPSSAVGVAAQVPHPEFTLPPLHTVEDCVRCWYDNTALQGPSISLLLTRRTFASLYKGRAGMLCVPACSRAAFWVG